MVFFHYTASSLCPYDPKTSWHTLNSSLSLLLFLLFARSSSLQGDCIAVTSDWHVAISAEVCPLWCFVWPGCWDLVLHFLDSMKHCTELSAMLASSTSHKLKCIEQFGSVLQLVVKSGNVHSFNGQSSDKLFTA